MLRMKITAKELRQIIKEEIQRIDEAVAADIPGILKKARLAHPRNVKVDDDVVGIKFSKSPQMNRSKHSARKGKVVSALKDAGFDNAKSLNKSDSGGYWQFQV
tara:strand:+ start:1528 stop:1836 length:309 start_codon:yes stop_codon:yes gene_type:complete